MKTELAEYDLSKLNKFVKELESGYAVDVGIFGAKKTKIEREDEHGGKSTITNPELGYIHEMGIGVPMRSFLRMPLYLKSEEILKEVMKDGALQKLAAGDVVGVLSDLGLECEKAIAEAFETGGYGDWKPNKKGTTTLIDTGQLRRSIASQVVKI
jgi:hypothetical protein